ncbi:hypothetical protein K438DRAFT_1783548 [Mycena galopus ATCC 62051]|nr:hypothetical protein K438DRAFT_1783548 [Mycena galopus ATCC 62051]
MNGAPVTCSAAATKEEAQEWELVKSGSNGYYNLLGHRLWIAREWHQNSGLVGTAWEPEPALGFRPGTSRQSLSGAAEMNANEWEDVGKKIGFAPTVPAISLGMVSEEELTIPAILLSREVASELEFDIRPSHAHRLRGFANGISSVAFDFTLYTRQLKHRFAKGGNRPSKPTALGSHAEVIPFRPPLHDARYGT